MLIDDALGQDIDLQFRNGSIRMQPGSAIVVQNGGGLRIEDVTAEANGPSEAGIHGCGFMWEGIDVEEGGRIIVKNSTIQDASTALGITGSADITVQDNSFDNNYRGVNIIPVGSRGSVGIKMTYLNFDFVQNVPPVVYNTFENLCQGIYASQSTLIMKRNTLRQVDYGARLFSTSATFIRNTFEDVTMGGIESLNSTKLWAFHNTMQNMNRRGIDYEGSGNLMSYAILKNTIASQDHCINLETSAGMAHLNVAENNLTLLPPTQNQLFNDRAAIRRLSAEVHQRIANSIPALQQLWITGSQMQELESIQFFNSFGQSVLYLYNTADAHLEVSLPSELKAGIYFLRLQLRSGEIQTQKILLQS